jgi:hypothetical protein
LPRQQDLSRAGKVLPEVCKADHHDKTVKLKVLISAFSRIVRGSEQKLGQAYCLYPLIILKLSGCDISLSHGMQDFIFASSFKSFGVAVATAAFKCACRSNYIILA